GHARRYLSHGARPNSDGANQMIEILDRVEPGAHTAALQPVATQSCRRCHGAYALRPPVFVLLPESADPALRKCDALLAARARGRRGGARIRGALATQAHADPDR